MWLPPIGKAIIAVEAQYSKTSRALAGSKAFPRPRSASITKHTYKGTVGQPPSGKQYKSSTVQLSMQACGHLKNGLLLAGTAKHPGAIVLDCCNFKTK